MAATLVAKQNTPVTGGMVPVRTNILRCLKSPNLDLFVWNEAANRHVLFRDADLPLSEACKEALTSNQSRVLYVREADRAQLCGLMLESLENLDDSEGLTAAERYHFVQSAVAIEVDRCLGTVCPSDYVSLSQRVGCQIRAIVQNHALLPQDLYTIARHDASTFAHVTNVAGYATLLAVGLGISDSATLEEIAVGGMLHDIGKRFVPPKVLSKPGKLTAEEWVTIQGHPSAGFKDLRLRSEVTRPQLMMVYQHHERVDGTGYPVQILGDEIHPWAKLLAVVDVFDALTGSRPYRKPMTRDEAVSLLQNNAGSHFDEEMVRCWATQISNS